MLNKYNKIWLNKLNSHILKLELWLDLKMKNIFNHNLKYV